MKIATWPVCKATHFMIPSINILQKENYEDCGILVFQCLNWSMNNIAAWNIEVFKALELFCMIL